MFLNLGFGVGAVLIVLLLVASALKILREYQRRSRDTETAVSRFPHGCTGSRII